MKKFINWCIVHGGQIITALAIVAATASVGTTCLFESYQPEVPKCLREQYYVGGCTNIEVKNSNL